MNVPSTPTDALTPTASMVNPTVATHGVNSAQAQASNSTPTISQSADIDAIRNQYEQRNRALMSEKDKALHDRNQAISQLTEMQKEYTTQQEQTQSSLTAAANSAQQAIDHAKTLERELAKERARNIKLAALMQRPHLAAYEKLIPEQSDEEKLKEVLDELEHIREEDMKRFAPPVMQAQPQAQPQAQSPFAQQASTLQALYGNRANMNPAFQQATTPIPASSPAQMNPAASSTDVISAINQLYADARRVGTTEAFEDATRRAAVLANSSFH